MAVLTVGLGQAYTTIASAVAASASGDTVMVTAGTYTNDFLTISHNLTVQGTGGTVTLVATVQPPNGKAIIDAGGSGVSVTLTGLTMSGASVADGNGAGIRYEGGTLTLNNDTFTGNQEGILGAPDPNGVITISNSTFNLNGSGTGYTHNIYVGAIASLTVQNSTIQNALVGHDIKSRAASNTITGNTIIDTGGTASYEIDLANGGVATISGNVIEKGPNAQNPFAITYGEEGAAYATNSLSVTGNLIVNDYTGHSTTAIRNSVSGVTAAVSGNTFYGWTNLTSGSATLSNNTVATVEPPLTPPLTLAPAKAPTITGTVANQVTKAETPVTLFSGVTVGDGNSGAIDTLTITVGGVGGALSGAGLATAGVYRLTGTAAAITSQLDAVSFTPTRSAPSTSSTTTFTLNLTSSAYATPTTDTVTSVVNREPPSVSIGWPAAGARLAIVDPTLTGTVDLADAGRVVTLSSGGKIIGSTVAAADGSWSDHVTLPGDGSYAVTASVVNAAGDTGLAIGTFVIDSTSNAGQFGTVTYDPASAAGDIFGLYRTVLGRTPDTLGLESWVAAEKSGMALATIAQSFLSSAEYSGRYGAAQLSNTDFVTQLFVNGLQRPPDAAGLVNWVQALVAGTSRAQVAVAFASSAEMRSNLASTFQAGVFVPGASEASVARLYYGLLGRAPDIGGLHTWVGNMGRGETVAQMAQDFLGSQEYAAGHAGLSNADFVNALYQGALGHAAANDAGAQTWIAALAGGASRASVAAGISEGVDASLHLLPVVENGFHLSA